MNYAIIEDFAAFHGGSTVTIDGVRVPAPALVEGIDGIRMLVLPADPIVTVNIRVWSAAAAAGAQAIVAISPSGSSAVIPAERWSDERRTREGSGLFSLGMDSPSWIHSDRPTPSYTEALFSTPSTPPSALVVPTGHGDFVHLHAHSEFSALDGLSTTDEMVNTVAAHGQTAVAITDHGTCAGHPSLHFSAARAGIKPIFGQEFYFVDDRRWRPRELPTRAGLSEAEWLVAKDAYDEDMKRGRDYWHLVLWAFTQEGLSNLWALTSAAHRPESKYYKPRIDWEILEQHSAGIGASTACLRGPISGALLQGNHELAVARMARLRGIFDDRLYVEIHTNSLADQVSLNQSLVSLAADHSLPVIAVSDSHYAVEEHRECHRVWMAMQTNSDLSDDPSLFAGVQDYHLLSSAEVAASLAYLGDLAVSEAMAQTVAVADRCTAIIAPESHVPVHSNEGSRLASIRRDRERLVDLCLASWDAKTTGKKHGFEVYAERFDREMSLIAEKGFCGYFLMVAEYCAIARSKGILIGPGRGSGGGCLVAYLAGITNIDSVHDDVLFERFMTRGRTALPDFDIDFPSSMRDRIMDDLKHRYGADHVVRIGTHIRLQNKGIVKALGRVLQGADEVPYGDQEKINDLIDSYEADSAGLVRPWDEIMEEDDALHAEYQAQAIPFEERPTLRHYADRYPALFLHGRVLNGRISTYGKHSAGVIISAWESIVDRLPLDFDGDIPISTFPMDAIEMLGWVKFDLLTLRTLDSLQESADLVAKRHDGNLIDFYSWGSEEYDDPAVWDLICSGMTLGMFQAETPSMTRLIKQFQPRSIKELADVITLVRPGPTRAGITAEYLARRSGDRPVEVSHEAMREILEPTQGLIIYQEQVMKACMVLAGFDEDEADAVRKILGKKQVEKVHDAGIKFVDACETVGLISRADAEHLWAQLAEFAKYSFGFAHALAYAILCHWTAWLKTHHPAEFLTGVLAHVKGTRIPDFVAEARLRGFQVLPPDVNVSGSSFSIESDTVVRYGFASLANVGPAGSLAVIEGQPYASFEDFIERKGQAANSGVVKRLAAVGAFDSLYPNRKALEAMLAHAGSPLDGQCRHKDLNALGPGGIPCRFDWSSVPVELTKSGAPKKNQRGAPKKCTKGCWQHDPIEAPDFDALDPYTSREIRDRESEVLGLYLSSSPFDDVPPDVLEMCATTADIDSALPGQELLVIAIVDRAKPWVDRGGNTMAFVNLTTHDGATVDLVCFASDWRSLHLDVVKGSMGLSVISKSHKGFQLVKHETIRREA